MKYLKLIIFSAILACPVAINAQNMSDMRLNEILVKNTNGYVDDYGNRSGWIELFNSSYGTVDVGGCFLTDDPTNLKKYPIPKGDILTKVKPRQHVLFYADSMATRGTFHLNFNLNHSTEVLFISSDGRTIIDRVDIPQNLAENQSYGRVMDGEGTHEPTHFMKLSYNINVKEAKVKGTNDGWDVLTKVTPSTNNVTLDMDTKGQNLKKTDPYGVIMSITAMSVVFLSLILLYVIFKQIGNNAIKKSRTKEALTTGKVLSDNETTVKNSAEVYAAIALSLHLYMEGENSHDLENTILTIHKESKTYSPWSSKIYTLRETPHLNRRK
jgi:Na+-transporting methylmalonyl-CoA/oxaloacetate decarboxylase gamma subunit